jgi:hypothetical protein
MRWIFVTIIYVNELALCCYLFCWHVACNDFNCDFMLIMLCYDLCVDVNFLMLKNKLIPIVLQYS